MAQTVETSPRDEGDIGKMAVTQEKQRKGTGMRKSIVKSTGAAPMTFLMQPLIVGRTLMQVGFEPLEPKLGRTLFGKQVYFYPNIFSYLNYVREEKGLMALWKGLTPRMLNLFISSFTENRLEQLLRSKSPYQAPDSRLSLTRKSFQGFLHEVAVISAAKTVSVIITNPLHVVMVRTISSLVSDDECYMSLYSTIKEIYNTEGISGFFRGLAPRWIGEIVAIVFGSSLLHFSYKLLKLLQADEIEKNTSSMGTLVQFGVASMTYRFSLVSTIAAASCPGLHLGFPEYKSWKDVYGQLHVDSQLSRGSSYFFRRALV